MVDSGSGAFTWGKEAARGAEHCRGARDSGVHTPPTLSRLSEHDGSTSLTTGLCLRAAGVRRGASASGRHRHCADGGAGEAEQGPQRPRCDPAGEHTGHAAGVLAHPPARGMAVSGADGRRFTAIAGRMAGVGEQRAADFPSRLAGERGDESSDGTYAAPFVCHASAGSRGRVAADPGLPGPQFPADDGDLYPRYTQGG